MKFAKREVTLPEYPLEELEPEQLPASWYTFSARYHKQAFIHAGSLPESWYEISEVYRFAASVIFEKLDKGRSFWDQVDQLLYSRVITNTVGLDLPLPFTGEQLNQAISEMNLKLVYFYMSGLSIELLLKGIIIAKHSHHVQPDGSLSRAFARHDLEKLLDLTNIRISEEEKSLLKKLTRFIFWQGRYPVPIKVENNTSQGWDDSECCSRKDKEDIDQLYKYIWEQRPKR